MAKYTNDEMTDVLKRALRQMKAGKAWCTGALARTAEKQACRYSSGHARYWDLVGAVLAATGDQYLASAVIEILERNMHRLHPRTVCLGDFNDSSSTKWKDITRLVNTTIKLFGSDRKPSKATHRGQRRA